MARPKGGYRLSSGDPCPGVTTITGRFADKSALMFWAFQQGKDGADQLYDKRDQAASIGTYVHKAWEAHLRQSAPPKYPDEFTADMQLQAQRGLEAALRWLEDTGLEIDPHETPLVSEKYHFGGTPDAIAKGKRGRALADWKSGGPGLYIDQIMQMAAYLHLIEEAQPNEEPLTDGVHIIRFGKMGGEFAHYHFPHDHPALTIAWEQFLSFISAYERDKQLKRLIG